MTEYLKKSFTVRFKSPAAKEKCGKCGVELPEVIYRVNRKPRCKECFTNKPTNKTKWTDDGVQPNTDETENREKQ